MMSFIYSVLLVISVLCINDISAIPDFDDNLTLSGQIIYPGGSRTSIPPDSRLIIDLEDISITHDLFTPIAHKIMDVDIFPIIFNISYSANQIVLGNLHVINARIINIYQDILFVNEKRIVVKLLGMGRTKFIDIPLVPYKLEQDNLTPTIKLLEWPELVGMDGDQAVELIKQQSGLKHVFVVTDETKVTKDLRYDRVCVYVDHNNKVIHIPKTA